MTLSSVRLVYSHIEEAESKMTAIKIENLERLPEKINRTGKKNENVES